MKTCFKCKVSKPADAFYGNNNHSYCKVCHRAWQRDAYAKDGGRKMAVSSAKRYAERKALVGALKSGPCSDCGGTFDPVCMDFDHRPDEVKEFCLSTRMGSRSVEAIVAEAAKCDVVCANCHRLRTFKQRDHGIFFKRRRRGLIRTNGAIT